MRNVSFDRTEHVYRNDAFSELVKDAIRFFNGTPALPLPPPSRFFGSGVYALYYTGKLPLYKRYAELNRLAYGFPIYIGKAVPRGWRQSRLSDHSSTRSIELYSRLREHARSIAAVQGFAPTDFSCRFVIFEDEGSDMISTAEAALIKLSRPLWNTVLDGFGNHDPGNGRYEQATSDWDVIHPGRLWATRLKGTPNSKKQILASITAHLASLLEGR